MDKFNDCDEYLRRFQDLCRELSFQKEGEIIRKNVAIFKESGEYYIIFWEEKNSERAMNDICEYERLVDGLRVLYLEGVKEVFCLECSDLKYLLAFIETMYLYFSMHYNEEDLSYFYREDTISIHMSMTYSVLPDSFDNSFFQYLKEQYDKILMGKEIEQVYKKLSLSPYLGMDVWEI